MKKIIIIFDSSKEDVKTVSEPITGLDAEYEIELRDINATKSTEKKKNNSLLYQHGTNNTPLYLFKEEDIYNSHYFEHGPITKDIALTKLNNG